MLDAQPLLRAAGTLPHGEVLRPAATRHSAHVSPAARGSSCGPEQTLVISDDHADGRGSAHRGREGSSVFICSNQPQRRPVMYNL
jgi:hypothetical protein